jgi:DNA-directed RNA polymerase specialized sigma subunit
MQLGALMKDFPFKDIFSLLSYLAFSNPCRYKSQNLIETERGHGELSAVDWSLMRARIERKLKSLSERDAAIFKLYYLTEQDIGVHDLADFNGITKRRVRQILERIRDDIERDFIDLEVIEPRDDRK